jgi:hypothetical protein
MGPIGCLETSVTVNLRCVASKKSKILSRDVPGLTAVRDTWQVSDSFYLLLFCLSALLAVDTVQAIPSSEVGILTRVRAGRSGVWFPLGTRSLSFSKSRRSSLGPTQTPVDQGSLGRETDSPPPSAEVKNEWCYTCGATLYAFAA